MLTIIYTYVNYIYNMAKSPSRKTKILRNMGNGIGKDHRPYITTSEFNSLGTTSVIKNWKTGRAVHCLSQAEAYWFYILCFSDENIDIREQYPLEREITQQIASQFGFKHPGINDEYIMTTDFLVTKDNKTHIAYSVKENDMLSDRALQILCIEKQYWQNKGIGFKVLFKKDVNQTLVENIRAVVPFYDINSIFDEYSEIKHLIAIKKVLWDMENVRISNSSIDEWRKTSIKNFVLRDHVFTA